MTSVKCIAMIIIMILSSGIAQPGRRNGIQAMVMTYGNPDQAKADAARISTLVNGPVWDAIDY